MIMRICRASLISAVLLALASAGYAASLVPPKNLGELVVRSDATVLATAMAGWAERRGTLIVTVTPFKIERIIKGRVSTSRPIFVETPGGELRDVGWAVPGSPRFQSGRSYFLPLTRSDDGTWKTLTLAYGILVRSGESGGPRILEALNEAGEIALFQRPDGAVAELPGRYLENELLAHASNVAAAKSEWDSRRALVPRSFSQESTPKIATPPASCAFLTAGDTNRIRWFTFDSGGTISMTAQNTGDSSISGGGFSELQSALANWSAVTGSSIKATYGGPVAFTLTCTAQMDDPPAGTNVVVFNDPCSDIADLSGCSGTLAFGGPWYSLSTQTFDGLQWHSIISWFVVVNNSSGCLGSSNYRLMLTHELGHGLGFDHVLDSNAVMAAFCCHEINSTDVTCAQYTYPGASLPPIANFTFSPASPTTGATVSFTDTSTGSPTSWSWNFGDSATSTLQNPTHVFASASTYNVSHTATNTNGTSSPIVKSVVVSNPSPPTASFTFSPFSPVTGQNVFFTDTSTGSPAPTSWAWNFGDPTSGGANTSTLQNPTHAFATVGTHTITLTATNTAGPSSPATQQITVSTPGVPPTAAFIFSPGSPQPGQSVTFTDTSTGGPTSWFWSFGDSSFAFTANSSHTYAAAGTFTVTLTATNNFGSSQASQNVTVSSAVLPSASFAFSPPTPQPGQSVTFTDTSSGSPTAWTWDFGDGASSSLRNPSHTYIGAGNYTVRLTAFNAAGSNSASQTVSVRVPTPCASDPGTLPANAGHNFCITLSARDPRTGNTGPGLAIPQNNLFGYFSIPALTSNPDNPEVFVKVLDGRVVNGFFWVFYGALTDLEYTITVRDFQTGLTKQYLKPAFSTEGGFDTSAFAGTSATLDPPSGAAAAGSTAAPVAAGCAGNVGTLCLNSSHSFFVSLSARDQRTGNTGPGLAIPQNDIFGYFSIPALTSNPDNPEVFVKVLDGRVVNDHYWVFFGGLTDLEYTITVREVSTGLIKTYFKPAGSAAGGFDTSAF